MQVFLQPLLLLLLLPLIAPKAIGALGDNSSRTKPVITVCSLPTIRDMTKPCHVVFAVDYYRASLPEIEWRWKYVTPFEAAGATAKNFVRSWVERGGDCRFLVGPGFSAIATAMSPLIDIPWVDASATSTELSDKRNHPVFSRVIPTDEVGARGAVRVFTAFGWTRTNLLCSDEPYGRSVAAGVSGAMRAINGSVDVQRCFETSASADRVRKVLNELLSSPTRIVFLATHPTHEWLHALLDLIIETGAHRELTFFFSEAFCSSVDRSYLRIPGSFCATYTSDASIMGPFLDAYRTADRSAEIDALVNIGYPPDVDIYSSGIYAVFAHDATLHGMRALHQYHLEKQSLNRRSAEELGSIVDYIRRFKSQGATGTIRLEPNGDRLVVDLVVYNAFGNQTEKTIAYVRDGTLRYHSDSPDDDGLMPLINFRGLPTRDIPAAFEPDVGGASGGVGVGVIVGVVVAVTVIFVAFAVALRLTAPKGRDLSCAPKDSSKPFAVVFTDIQSSTTLWAREPEIMSEAVELHHTTIREVLHRHKGYEVKTIGDSFMCGFVSKHNAVAFALDVQVALHSLQWFNGQIDQTYRELLMESGIVLPSNYEECWNGLRVRVGINFGLGSIQFDPVTNAVDLYGTVVNSAARVESVGHGGQVLITDAVREDLQLPAGARVTDLGPQPLRGLDDPIRLHQVDPPGALSLRSFPPLRLDQEVDVEELTDASQHSSHSVMSTHSNVSVRDVLGAKAAKYAKNMGFAGAAATTVSDEVMHVHHFTKVLFSTCKEEFRHKTLVQLAQKWRIPDVSAKTLKTTRGYESALMDVVAKALQATQAQGGGPRFTKVEMLGASGLDSWGPGASVNSTARPLPD